MNILNGQAILGDCLEKMKDIPDGSISCCIIDPPYNISKKTNFHTMKGHRGTSMDYGEWDKGFDLTGYIELLPRVLKKGGNVVIFNDWKNLGEIAKKMNDIGITPKRCIVLNKSNPAPFNRDRMFVNDVEFAVWGTYKEKWTFNRQLPLEKCILNTNVQSKKYHPTMKDLKIIIYLIKILSNEGDTIFDPFAGSFTAAIAAENTNRKWICIEKDENYYNIGIDRLKSII